MERNYTIVDLNEDLVRLEKLAKQLDRATADLDAEEPLPVRVEVRIDQALCKLEDARAYLSRTSKDWLSRKPYKDLSDDEKSAVDVIYPSLSKSIREWGLNNNRTESTGGDS